MAGQKTDARDVHVGQRIAEQRKKAALTQKRVAQSFGMSAAQLQKYEKGTNRISAIHLDTFSRMTGVPIAYFFDGLDHGETASAGEASGPGFSEPAQQTYASENPWLGLAEIVVRHVRAHFPEAERRQFAAALQVIDDKLVG
ncbi:MULTISPECIES: helix-turn-helix transcriptional regulator [unclassified Methylobacterium]|jgi:transcriptional regulator with XRE-family HTH domain|uniref:helix-turn-helix domain-containing protein n=1 Tax=unclassified Methylobacterium TaxID=2615210 RepID=UPI0006FC155C|nr:MULTISPECIES: helix-turn-helix transcriptional regulator [unclassified Methylobacterium]KQP89359.1 XRE family transcriptional regulator [Methylobacterium sp. Leaf113]MCK2056000.1 helix-turn-helix transcriptional regulator [Methylobacterium sp. 37f]